MNHDKAAAIVTAYKPDDGFVTRFELLLKVCNFIVVIDNTPGGHRPFDNLPPKFILLQNGQNMGLAYALNAGIDRARRLGASSVVLFDQDSTPSLALIDSLTSAKAEAVATFGERCCVAPTHIDDGLSTRRRHGELKELSTANHSLMPVTCLPTSGMMFGLNMLDEKDVFCTDLFLDLVDFEWCWRLRTAGWTFLRASNISMYHRLGLSQKRFLGFIYHVPAPYRHYFQVRDSLRLVFKGYVPNYSKLRLIGILPLKALTYPFILDHGFERLSWMMRGVLDSLRGVQGIGAAAKRLSR